MKNGKRRKSEHSRGEGENSRRIGFYKSKAQEFEIDLDKTAIVGLGSKI